MASATGKKDSVIKAEYEKLGDLGLVAVAARNTQKYSLSTLFPGATKIVANSLSYHFISHRTMFPPPPLTISFVFNTLNQIAKAAGRAVHSPLGWSAYFLSNSP